MISSDLLNNLCTNENTCKMWCDARGIASSSICRKWMNSSIRLMISSDLLKKSWMTCYFNSNNMNIVWIGILFKGNINWPARDEATKARIETTHTLPTKVKHPSYNIRMYWTNSCQPTVRIQQNIFEQTLIEVGNLHLYASFGTFCVQIGQLFESQWAFEECLNIDKSLFSKENVADFDFLRMFKHSLLLE